jgi:ribosomal protein S1
MAKALKDDTETDPKQSKMAQLLAEKGWEPKVLSKGEAVSGTIEAIVSDSVLIDIGAKAEGIIPRKELQDAIDKIEIGAKINAVVAQTEGDSGTVVLTVRKNVLEKVWSQLQKIAENNESIDVKTIGANRGGMIVEYKGVRGFIPSSHLVSGSKSSIGKNISVKVLQENKDLNKLVLSEKETSSETLPKVELPFKIDDTLEVKVTKILNFGILVALPSGSDGLVHISEISWKKVTGLADKFKVGQELKAKVISIDPNSGRINLSIKQLEKDPWVEAAKKYKVGSVFDKPVSRTTSYGVFVELDEGIEGLLHSSKIPYGKELKKGDKIKISVDLFNSEQRRVALRLAPGETEKDNKETKKEKKIVGKKEVKKTNLKKGKKSS